MHELVNLVVALDERFDEAACASARLRVAATECTVVERASADDRTLAWIDLRFGGSWSGEALRSRNVVAVCGGEPVGFASFAAQGLHYRWLRGMASEPGVGVFGPFGVAESDRGRGIGGALATIALCGLRRLGFKSALIAAVGDERLVGWYARACRATVAERFDRSALVSRTRAVVMASGAGTNAQTVMRASQCGAIPLDIAAVVTNHPDAGVRERASALGVQDVVLEWRRDAEAREAYDERLLQCVRALQPELVLLLGWMHLLPWRFVDAFGELLNLHPAFLPLDPSHDVVGMPDGSMIPVFRGPHAVRDAVRMGCRWIGSSVHRVTAQTDRGSVLMRVPLQLQPGEDEERAYARLRSMEHALVPRAVMCWAYER